MVSGFESYQNLDMAKVTNEKERALGKKVKKFRKLLGITQEKLAEKLGISAVYMGFIEQSREIPSLKLLMKIADKLNKKIEDLF